MSVSKLNPQIKTVGVGVRELREVKVYPLSVKDQFEITKEIADSINDIMGGFNFDNMTEAEAVDALAQLISENLTKILKYVCDEDKVPSVEELTNDQLSQFATIIFEVNYEGLIKNFKDLFERGKKLMPKLPQIQAAPTRTK